MASGVSADEWTRESVVSDLNESAVSGDDLRDLNIQSTRFRFGHSGIINSGLEDLYGISRDTAKTIHYDYPGPMDIDGHDENWSAFDPNHVMDALVTLDTDLYPFVEEIPERYRPLVAKQILWFDKFAAEKYLDGPPLNETHTIEDGEIVPADTRTRGSSGGSSTSQDEDDDEDVNVGLNAGEDTDEDVDEDVDEDTSESENETTSESTDDSPEFGLGTVSNTTDEFDGPEEILDFSFRVSDNSRMEYSLNRETNVIEGNPNGLVDELYVGSVSDLVDAVIHVDDFEAAESVFVENDDVVLRGDTSKTRTAKNWFTQAENVVRLYGDLKYLIGFSEYGDAFPIISTEDKDFAVLIKRARGRAIVGFPAGVEESEEAEEQEEPEPSEESNQSQNQTQNLNPKPPEPDEDGDVPEDIYIDTVANLSDIGESTAEDLYMDGAPTPDEWLTEDGDLIDIVQDNVHTRFHDDLIEDVETTEFGFGNLETSDAAKAMGDHLERSPNAIRSDEAKQAKNVTEDYDEWSEAPGQMDFVGVDGGDPDDLETDDEQTTFGAASFMNDEDEEDGDMKTVEEYGDARLQKSGDQYRLEVTGDTYDWSADSDTPDFLNVSGSGINEDVVRVPSVADILIVDEIVEGGRHVPVGALKPMLDVMDGGRESIGYDKHGSKATIEDHPKVILRILSEHSKAGNETYIQPAVLESYANGDYEGTFPEQDTDTSMDFEGETVSMTANPADSPTGIGSFAFEAYGDRVEWTSDDKPEMLGISEDGVEEISRLKFKEDYDDLAIDGDIHRTQGTDKLLLISEYPHKEAIKSADYDKSKYYFIGSIKRWAIDPTGEAVDEMVRNLVEEEGKVAVDTVAIEEVGRHQ